MPIKGQPLAEGAFITTRGQETLRRETWQIARMAHGLLLTSRAELTQPRPIHWNYSYTVTQHWDPADLAIRVEADGHVLSGELRLQPPQSTMHISPRGGEPRDAIVNSSPQSQLDLDSPLFTNVILVRLNLPVGQSREVETVCIPLPELEPRLVKQKYTCIGEEQIDVPAGKFTAWHYTVTSDGDPAESHFWADLNGTILQQRFADGSETKLARYRRTDRR